MANTIRSLLLLAAALTMLGGCQAKTAGASVQKHNPSSATAALINTDGEKIGQADFRETKDGVQISLQASGLRPGMHAIHIHEKGMCLRPDFKSAEGHFNPFGKAHGFDNKKGSHAGDLPNIEVQPDGTVKTRLLAAHVTLQSGKINSLLTKTGTALVIHDKPDDYYTDPAGDAGSRVACGVIQPAGPADH